MNLLAVSLELVLLWQDCLNLAAGSFKDEGIPICAVADAHGCRKPRTLTTLQAMKLVLREGGQAWAGNSAWRISRNVQSRCHPHCTGLPKRTVACPRWSMGHPASTVATRRIVSVFQARSDQRSMLAVTASNRRRCWLLRA